MVQLDHRGRKGSQDHKGLQETTEQMVLLDRKGQQVHKDQQETTER
jgi:hypothetical protein